MRYALVFDFGGVLMKTATRAPRWAWDDRLGLLRGAVERAVHNTTTWFQAQTGQIPVADYWQDVARQLNITEADISQLDRDFYSGDQLDKDIIALIRRQKAAGQKIALLSNDSPALIDKLNYLGIADLFDPLIVSAHIGVMKPAADAYYAVLQRLELPPSDAVFIDDMPANVEGARAVGMTGVLYTPQMDLEFELAPFFQ